jgi:hypothetical protein
MVCRRDIDHNPYLNFTWQPGINCDAVPCGRDDGCAIYLFLFIFQKAPLKTTIVKKLIIIVILIAGLGRLNAQDISGSWAGVIAVSGVHLHLVFNVKKLTDTSYSSTMDSPDQKAFGIACNATYLKKDSLFISVAIIKGGYNGLWKGGDTISGIFRQGGARIPIGLKRISAAEKAQLSTDPVRPQTPKPPFAYFSEEVEYDNADKSMHYGATFTRPSGDGKYPAAIIIS